MTLPSPIGAEESTVDLLRRAGEGEDAAREALFRRYLRPLRRWAHGRVPAAARPAIETDDLVQETLVSSLGRLDDFDYRHPGAFEDYLRRALLNKIRDQARRASRGLRRGDGGEPADPGPSPLEEALGRESVRRYETALASLRPADRRAVFARIELRLPYDEVARVLDKRSADAARMAVARAVGRLAEAIAEDKPAER